MKATLPIQAEKCVFNQRKDAKKAEKMRKEPCVMREKRRFCYMELK